MERNLRLYPWYQSARNLLFWQGVWFLYFEKVLSAEEAIFLAAIFELGSVILEVPSGYFSDAVGRRITLLISAFAAIAAYLLFYTGNTFAAFVAAQLLWSVAISFNSGTDSAILYDSLHALGRTQEIAESEARAWRYSYIALALSAALGGLMATGATAESYALTYFISALAGLATLGLAWAFTEPPNNAQGRSAAPPVTQFGIVIARLRDPVLRWMLVFIVTLYVLSHVPFVFVQPYVRELLAGFDLARETPAITGMIVALMMAVSAILGWFVVSLRDRFGTKMMFVTALLLQTGLIAAMAWIIHPLVIGFLLLRMVPGALTRPFFLEAIQPRLQSSYRATYLSVQSLIARLVFSAALFAAAAAVTGTGTLDRAGLTQILPWFALAATVLTAWLWWSWPNLEDRDDL